MRSLRGSLLVAVVLVAALAVVVQPAFATPRLTESTGATPVAPFITPITNTRSPFTGRAIRPTLSLPAFGGEFRCESSFASGYMTTTHTQARITSLSFGNGVVGTCTMSRPAAGIVDQGSITCNATSINPWLLHVQARNAGNNWSGTVNIPAGGPYCRFDYTVPSLGVSCTLTFDASQSIGRTVQYTNVTSQINLIRAQVRATVRETPARRCPAPFPGTSTATFNADYNVRPDTVRDGTPTVTAGS